MAELGNRHDRLKCLLKIDSIRSDKLGEQVCYGDLRKAGKCRTRHVKAAPGSMTLDPFQQQ